MKNLLLVFCFTSFLNALVYDIESLKKHENSLAKDYYIHRLLVEKSLSKKDVEGLNSHIFRYVGKLKTELEKILPLKPYVNPLYAKCFNFNQNNILDANLTCQNVRLNSIPFISSLNSQTRSLLAKNLLKDKPELSHLLLAFNTDNPMAYICDQEDVGAFFRLYDYSKQMDSDLNIAFINKLAKHNKFESFVQNIVIRKEHPKLRYSLLKVNPNLVKKESAFYLGVNALTYNRADLAFDFFKSAYESFTMQSTKDNALFWMWKITKDEKFLNELVKSSSVNIYSLYAKELLNKDLPEIVVPTTKKKTSDFNMQDPFAWQKLAKQIRDSNSTQLLNLSKKFNSEETLPIYTYILERSSGFKKNYFIMPYYEHLKDYNITRQALILAIARQESRFIPSAISTSYALGMMQFMPFLANHIGKKELKIQNFDQDDMFNPQTAYYFANHHLNYLEKHLNSPLYVAYAYNGGIGFTNKMLARKDLFKQGEFEPFLSMELVPYQESRIYGKKVLANYIVYRHLLNDNTKISDIFENLIQNKD